MKDSLRRLREMEREVERLREQVDDASKPDSIDLLIRGLDGDTAAADELRHLGAEGKVGKMHEMLDAIVQPLAADGGGYIDPEDLERPEA